MPLTAKGDKILAAMIEKYGEKKGKEVFYASRNKGTITGVDAEAIEDSICLTDSFVLDGVHRSKDGYLAAYANVARTGIQTYKGKELGRPDLGDVKVYRPPEEVFNHDAMHSMAHRPVTLHHPTETVNARNWKKYAKGHTGDEVIRDGDHIRVPVVVMDAETIQAFENKDACELSMGYSTDLKWTPGETPDGQTYDAVQTAIRANHLAIVPVARGGSTLKLGDDWSEEARAAAIEARKAHAHEHDPGENHTLEGNRKSGPSSKDISFIKKYPTDDNLRVFVRQFGRSALPNLNDSISFRDLVHRMNDNVVEMEDDEVCPYCDEPIEPGDLVCPHCGADLEEDDDVNDSNPDHDDKGRFSSSSGSSLTEEHAQKIEELKNKLKSGEIDEKKFIRLLEIAFVTGFYDGQLEDEHLEVADYNKNHDPQTGRFTSAENIAGAKTLNEQHGVSFRAEGTGKNIKFFHTPPGGIEHGPFDIYSRAINHAAGVVGAPHITVPEVENLDPKVRKKQLREAKRATKNALVPYGGGSLGPHHPGVGKTPQGAFTSKHEAKEFIRKNRRIWRNARVVTKVEKSKEPFRTGPFESLGYGLAGLGIAHRTKKKSFHVHHDGIQDEWLDDDGECSIIFDADSELQDECLEDSLVDVIDGEPIYLDDYDPNEPRDPHGRWTRGELELTGHHFGFQPGGVEKGYHISNPKTGVRSGASASFEEAQKKIEEHLLGKKPELVVPKTKEDVKRLGYSLEKIGSEHFAVHAPSGYRSDPKSDEFGAVQLAVGHAQHEQKVKHEIRQKEFEQRTKPVQLPAVINVPAVSGVTPSQIVVPTSQKESGLKLQAQSQLVYRNIPTSFPDKHSAQSHIQRELDFWKNASVVTHVYKTRENLKVPTLLGGKLASEALAFVGIKHRYKSPPVYSIKSSRDSVVTDAANDDGIGNNETEIGDNQMAKTITIDSVPVETTDVGAAVIQRYVAKLEGDIKTLQDAWNDKKKKDEEAGETTDGFKKQIEAKDGEIAVLKKQLADAQLSPEKIDALVKDRATIIDAARVVLDNHFVFDGKKVEDIRRAAVVAKLGDAVVKDMSDAAVEGAFKALTADAKAANTGTRPLARALFDQQSNAHRPGNGGTDLRDAAMADREKYLNNAWKGQSATGNNS